MSTNTTKTSKFKKYRESSQRVTQNNYLTASTTNLVENEVQLDQNFNNEMDAQLKPKTKGQVAFAVSKIEEKLSREREAMSQNSPVKEGIGIIGTRGLQLQHDLGKITMV